MLGLFLSAVLNVSSLDQAAAALEEFRTGDALPLLERARSEGPYAFADHVRLYGRAQGEPWRSQELRLEPPGRFARVVLPAPGGEKNAARDLRLVAFDPRGDEVLLWGSEAEPRRITARYEPPAAWYQKWWV